MPEQGPDWFLVATQACGGGTPDLGYVLGVSVYIRSFGVENKSGGLRAAHEGGGRAQGVLPHGQPGDPPDLFPMPKPLIYTETPRT